MVRSRSLPPATVDPLGRFFAQVDRRDDGCWWWVGPRSRRNNVQYGAAAGPSGRTIAAHRLAYELLVGPIPDGLQIDHLCRNTRCVNPDHLEAVTQRENILRGNAPAAENARKTHCIRGHAFDEANTIIQRSGKRSCRTCVNEAQRRNRLRRLGRTA